jgi:hypothetical protein
VLSSTPIILFLQIFEDLAELNISQIEQNKNKDTLCERKATDGKRLYGRRILKMVAFRLNF